MALLKDRGLLYRLAGIGRYLLMILLALIFALPIIYMLVSSLKPVWQILQDSSSIRAFLPVGDISFANYVAAFRFTPVARFLFNSAVVSSLTVLGGLIVNSLAAFALSRLRWKGRLILLSLIITAIIIPFEAIAIPLLLIVNNLPWIGRFRDHGRLARLLSGADHPFHRRCLFDFPVLPILQKAAG